MKAYVQTADPFVTGVHARVATIYEGTRITFSGAAGGRGATIDVTMHPQAALSLALDLIRSVEKHGQETTRNAQTMVRRLGKRVASKESGNEQ